MTNTESFRFSSHRSLSAGCVAAAAFFLLPVPFCFSQALSETPVLCIEAGMHVARITSISSDTTGRLVLTVSLDKTARLWSMDPGSGSMSGTPKAALLRTLRPPLGGGPEGMLYSCALSPDGKFAAVGGYTGKTGSKDFPVYLFDTATGRLLRCLDGLSDNVALGLDFSASGRHLAAGFGGNNGIRIWELPSGRLIGQDTDYGEMCAGLKWHGHSRLAAVCFDGEARVYELDFSSFTSETPRTLRPKARAAVPGGQHPLDIGFSPDGTQLAVVFDDSMKAAVLDGETLAFQFAPETSGVENDYLSSVAWSADGRTLAAGMRWNDGTRAKSIRLWNEAGKGTPRDVSASRDMVRGLRPQPGGGFLFGAADPAWGLLPSGGSTVTLGQCSIADYSNNREGFRLSADCTVVAFGYESFGKSPHSFSLVERALTSTSEDTPLGGLRPPRTEGLPVTDWLNSYTPNLNGKYLEIRDLEMSRSLAIAPDDSFFLLGTNFKLRCFDAKGSERWQVNALGPTWAVNLSADGRLAVAAYGDGTIRWHRADTGQELLAFFPHADRKRWALWATDSEEMISHAPYTGLITDSSGILTIPPDSPAALAGAKTGDEFSGYDSGSEEKHLFEIGRKVSVVVLRNGKRLSIPVTVGSQSRTAFKPRAIYYDASPGAEEFLGWHVNRGKDQAADFFPAAKFRDQFYRPDVVRRVLETLDVTAAVKAADEAAGRKTSEASASEVIARMQPPVVQLAVGGVQGEAEVNGESFTLRYRIRSATAEPVTRLRVLIDGRPITAELPIPANAETETSATVSVPARDCVLSLLAENRFAMSEPVTLRLIRTGAPTPAQPLADEVPSALKPKLYLLAVGVNDYENNEALPDLDYAAKDAKDFAAVFQSQEGGLYQKVEAKVLTDAGATAADVLDGLDWIRQEATAKDLAVVFFAGHGENDEELRYYYCPSDYDPKRRLRTGVAMEEIQKTLSSIPGKVLFFIDTCHAGNALGKLFAARSAGGGVDINRLVNELSSAENGAIVFASSTGRQQSVESDEWQNGAFTKAIVEGLSGQADLLKNGKITVSTLESWVAERVKELSEGQQTPTVAKPQTVPDFPIAVKR